MSIPTLLTLNLPSNDERRTIEELMSRLSYFDAVNREAEQRYEGSFVAKQFGISIPPSMQNLHTVTGWAGTMVDVIEERLDWWGWASDDNPFGLDEVYSSNALDVDSGMAHLDSLIFGTSFIAVGTGEDGEPSPLVSIHSPQTMTAKWDARSRRASAALSVTKNDDDPLANDSDITLYLPNETISFTSRRGTMVVTYRDRHNLNRLPIVAMPNRVRGSRRQGRSEITKPIRYYSDAAARTLLGLEVNREFYNSPQRVALNVNESEFEDESGERVSQWTSIMGRYLAIPPNNDGDPEPKIQQFSPSSPAPYLDQIKGYAALVASEAGIPGDYLGFQTDNPTSADAIRAGEARLVKRAERRQTSFGRSWLEVGRLAVLIRDGSVPDDFESRLSDKQWRDAATPTRAAAADEALKLTSGDNPILPPDSSVTYNRIGLSPSEQRQIESDKRRLRGTQTLAGLTAAADAARRDPAVAALSGQRNATLPEDQ